MPIRTFDSLLMQRNIEMLQLLLSKWSRWVKLNLIKRQCDHWMDCEMTPRTVATRTNRTTRSALLPRMTLSYQTVGLYAALVEATVVVAGTAVGKTIYEQIKRPFAGEVDDTLGLSLLMGILYVSIAHAAGLYRLPALIRPTLYIRRIFSISGLVLLSMTTVIFLLKSNPSLPRSGLFVYCSITLVLCYATRLGVADVIEHLISLGAVAGRRVFLIGDKKELSHLTPNYLLRQFGLREVGRQVLDFSISADVRDAKIEEATQLARMAKAREFIVASHLDHVQDLASIEQSLRLSPLPVRLLPNHVFRSIIGRHASTLEASVHLLEMQRSPMRVGEQAIKRLVDIAIASVAIVLLSPLLVIAACAIKFDSDGPVIFRQRRNGFDQTQFVIFKFRSMNVQEDGPDLVQVRREDDRVTRVGRLLRRTSIDELPQLFNVLKGDMSIVGPRPHALAHDNKYKEVIHEYCVRHHVKPGITGWAQVNGLRGETAGDEDMRNRIDLDVWYINNWSLFLDLRILMRTVIEVIGHDAY